MSKLVPDPFLEKTKFSISMDQWSEYLYSLFLFYIQVEDCQNIFKLRCCRLAFTSYKTFLQNEKKSGTSLFHVLKKNICHVIFY